MTKATFPSTLSGTRGIAWLGLLAILAAPAAGGCQCSRRPSGEHGPGSAGSANPAKCEGARATAAAVRSLRAPAPVQQLAVAAGPSGSMLLAVAKSLVHAGPGSGRALQHIGTGEGGKDVEQDPAVTASGKEFAAVWRRRRGDADYLVFARLRPDGSLEGSERAEPLFGARPGVAIASSGTGLAVALATEGAVGVRLLAADGKPLGAPLLLPGSGGGTSPAIAFQAPGFVAAWTSPGSSVAVDGSASPGTITTARIDPASREVRQLAALVSHSPTARAALASAGERILMAWSDRDAGEGPWAVYTAAFDRNGVRLAQPERQPGLAIDAAPALASGASFASVAWTEPGGGGRTKSFWARLGDAGERSGEPLAVQGGEVVGPAPVAAALAWDGAAFVLVRPGAQPTDVDLYRFGPFGCDARP